MSFEKTPMRKLNITGGKDWIGTVGDSFRAAGMRGERRPGRRGGVAESRFGGPPGLRQPCPPGKFGDGSAMRRHTRKHGGGRASRRECGWRVSERKAAGGKAPWATAESDRNYLAGTLGNSANCVSTLLSPAVVFPFIRHANLHRRRHATNRAVRPGDDQGRPARGQVPGDATGVVRGRGRVGADQQTAGDGRGLCPTATTPARTTGTVRTAALFARAARLPSRIVRDAPAAVLRPGGVRAVHAGAGHRTAEKEHLGHDWRHLSRRARCPVRHRQDRPGFPASSFVQQFLLLFEHAHAEPHGGGFQFFWLFVARERDAELHRRPFQLHRRSGGAFRRVFLRLPGWLDPEGKRGTIVL